MSEPDSKGQCPIVVDTVEKCFEIFGDPNFTPKAMEWGSHPDHAQAVASIGSMLAAGGLSAEDIIAAHVEAHKDLMRSRLPRFNKGSLRSIDDDWMS